MPTTKYTFLEPALSKAVPQTTDPSLIIAAIWPYLWQILIVTVMGAFAYAAFKYFLSAGSAAEVKDGKEIAFRAAGTLLITTLIYLFLRESAPGFIQGSSLLKSRAQTTPVELSISDDYRDTTPSDNPGVAPTPAPKAGAPAGSTGDQVIQGMLANASQTRSSLAASGIQINKNECQAIGQSGCTSVGGLLPKTQTMAATLKASCGCTVMINGGTEWWLHNLNNANRADYDSNKSNHKPVGGAIDLSKNSALDSYIRDNGKKLDATHYSLFNYNFYDEDAAHWHVQPL